ncbi:MAG: MFS transporter, partial [Janthinobacterium lividum]
QALGGCAGLALGRAIARDTATPAEAVRDLALLNLMMMIGPGISPLIGSVLNATFGWRAIFVVLCTLGAVTLALSWRLLPETGRPTGSVRIGSLLGDYKQLLRMPVFVGFAIGGGCATTAVYGFIAAAPFIISVQLHRPLHEVGIYIALVIIGMSVGNFTTRQLVRTVALKRLMMIGNALCTASALSLLAVVVLGDLNLFYMTGLMFVFATGAGLASPAALAKALGVDAKLVGSAAGCYGFLQMAVGAACSALVGVGHDPALTTGMVLTGATLIGQSGFWFALYSERAASKRKPLPPAVDIYSAPN